MIIHQKVLQDSCKGHQSAASHGLLCALVMVFCAWTSCQLIWHQLRSGVQQVIRELSSVWAALIALPVLQSSAQAPPLLGSGIFAAAFAGNRLAAPITDTPIEQPVLGLPGSSGSGSSQGRLALVRFVQEMQEGLVKQWPRAGQAWGVLSATLPGVLAIWVCESRADLGSNRFEPGLRE